MLSKNSIKYINSLRVKKFRNESNLFIAEGERLVGEIIESQLKIKTIYYCSNLLNITKGSDYEFIEISPDEMKKISGLTTPSKLMAVVNIPNYSITDCNINNSLVLALDDIQDPGNLGTIVRLADWFGIDSILCSNNTVDAYSPKVVQACMGAISRVKIIYCDLESVLQDTKKLNLPIYGTFMEGANIYNENLAKSGVVVMGNEGNGISKGIEKLITKKIHIPSFANNRTTVESLNVAMATAIVLSEFRRR